MGSGEIKCQRVWIQTLRKSQYGVTSPILGLPTVQTGNFTLLAGFTHFIDVTAGSIAVQAPPIHDSQNPSGEEFWIHLVTDNVEIAAINGPSGGTINGGAVFNVDSHNQFIHFQRDVNDWKIVDIDLGKSWNYPTFETETVTNQIATTGRSHLTKLNIGAGGIFKLPAAPLPRTWVNAKNIHNNQVTVDGNGNNIDGTATIMMKKNEFAGFFFDGTEWFIVGANI